MTDNNHLISVPPELVKQMATKNGTHYESLADHCQIIADQAARWGYEQRAALAMPERLTVQEISGLPKHGENCIREDGDDKILLDGHFSRADLQQLADSIPRNSQPTLHHD